MNSRLLIFIVFSCWLTALNAEPPKPQARASLLPQAAVWAGQPLTLEVDVLVPGWFTRGLGIPAIQITGVAVVESCSHGFNYSTRIDGVTFAAQKRTYLVIPQHAGLFQIPPLDISVTYTANSVDKNAEAQLRLPSQYFQALAPPVLDDASKTPIWVASAVTIEQTFDRSLTGLKVGEALTRRLRIYGENTLAAMIPALHLGEPSDSVLRYPGQAIISDVCQLREGFKGGERIESYTYIMQKSGEVTLPELSLNWFNPATMSVETFRLAALSFDVTPAESSDDWFKGGFKSGTGLLLIVSIGLITTAALIGFSIRNGETKFATLKARWQYSEYYHYWRLKRACQNNNSAEAYSALQHWWPMKTKSSRLSNNYRAIYFPR